MKKKKVFLSMLVMLSLAMMTGCGKSDAAADEQEAPIGLPNPMVAYDSIDEVGAVLDYTPSIPETAMAIKSVYIIDGDLLQIEYEDNGNIITFRTAPGDADISGVYDTFSYKTDIDISGKTVTIQGSEENALTLAVWKNKDFSYSLMFTNPVTLETISSIINNIKF